MNAQIVLIALISLFALVSRASKETVVNGLVTTGYPSVILLDGCTGSFVGPGVIATELHCVQGARYGEPIEQQGYWVRSAKDIKVNGQSLGTGTIYSRGKYTANSDMEKNNTYNVDLAFIELSSVPNQNHMTISTDPIPPNSDISFVGFSPVLEMYKFEEQSDVYRSHFPIKISKNIEKKVGFNKIWKRDQEYLFILGKLESDTNDGSHASSGEGDSGGPMIFNGKIAGIVHGGAPSPVKEKIGSKFVDLSFSECKELIKILMTIGVPISVANSENL